MSKNPQEERHTITFGKLDAHCMVSLFKLPDDGRLVCHDGFFAAQALIPDIFNPPRGRIALGPETLLILSLLLDSQVPIQVPSGIKNIPENVHERFHKVRRIRGVLKASAFRETMFPCATDQYLPQYPYSRTGGRIDFPALFP